MEVRIRLQKSDTKAKGKYNYRVVAISKAAPRQSKALERWPTSPQPTITRKHIWFIHSRKMIAQVT